MSLHCLENRKGTETDPITEDEIKNNLTECSTLEMKRVKEDLLEIKKETIDYEPYSEESEMGGKILENTTELLDPPNKVKSILEGRVVNKFSTSGPVMTKIETHSKGEPKV